MHEVIIRDLGIQPYLQVWENMRQWTIHRTPITPDELWRLEHEPVYTQGQAGKPEHIIDLHSIPIVQSDRGGQITYHGPGQLVLYTLLDIQRRQLGIRTLVAHLEQSIIKLLMTYHIEGVTQCGAPGVYVHGKKIASIGLRVKNGCTYHGLALNIDMDLTPFDGINPCGYQQLKMTQMRDWINNPSIEEISQQLTHELLLMLGTLGEYR